MQIRADMTKDELLNSRAVGDEAVFPLSKLKLVAEIFGAMGHSPKEDDDTKGYLKDHLDLYTIHEIIMDAAKDIGCLFDIADKREKALRQKLKAIET